MKALFLNCTLKKNPETSNTDALIQESKKILESEGVEVEVIRPVDFQIDYGVQPRMSDQDQWPELFEKVINASILVIGTPIWLGEKSSIATKVIERLYGQSGETNEKGQYIYYNKVGGCLATGNEDGGKEVSRSILYALQHLGYTIPPQADAYWVGEAGPGPSYIEAGQENEFTKRNTKFMTYNLVHFARRLQKEKIPAYGNIRNEREGANAHPCKR